ncbi:MAG: hypothetical protein A2X49_13260 [Lentisphaerae bacterium GWF2_52_8]|nr:MAG: hypothetical protein A2X49_13260 [Lentisphaerae bacterium GWF2_52_8]
MAIAAALDLSGREAVFALQDEKTAELLCDASIPMSGREASGLLKWILAELEKKGILLDSISSWTVGSGPGSFTGLRLASSLVMGLSWERPGVRVRSLPSALAIAAALPEAEEGVRAAVLYDGHRGEVLVFGTMRQGGEWAATGLATVLTPDTDARELLKDFDILAALRRDEESIAAALPPDLVPRIRHLEKLRASALLRAATGNWTGKLTELVYIRPAVFVAPRQPRENLV